MFLYKNSFKKIIFIAGILLFLLFPGIVLAHQPRIPEGNQTTVLEPEVSKAYYTRLQGTPQTYSIVSDTPFALYVNILVPDIPGQKQDITVKIIKDGNTEIPFATLDGSTFTWTKLFEPFGYDTYWAGPEYKANVAAGKYDIIVSSLENDSKYSLAVGETELFDFPEIINALTLVPQIKRNFFEESPISFILSPFGAGLIVIMFVLAFILGFTYRFILRRFTKNIIRKNHTNIGTPDRLIRMLIGICLLILSITTSWSPILLFFSGFALFEALFSWCGLYAALGKSTCPWNASDNVQK